MQFQYMGEFFVSSLGVFQNEDMYILIHVWMEAIELGLSQPHISASKGKKQKQLRREKKSEVEGSHSHSGRGLMMKFLSLKTREPQNLEVSGNFVAEILVIHFFSRF